MQPIKVAVYLKSINKSVDILFFQSELYTWLTWNKILKLLCAGQQFLDCIHLNHPLNCEFKHKKCLLKYKLHPPNSLTLKMPMLNDSVLINVYFVNLG